MLRAFIQITALILTLCSAFFLTKGNLQLGPEAIAELALTKLTYNSDVARSFSAQRTDTWIGVVFLVVAFGLQLWNSLWTMKIGEYGPINKSGLITSIIFCLVVFGISWQVSQFMAGRTFSQVEMIIDARISQSGSE